MTATPDRLIAIHQPNYAPWLGWFHKVARADCFVLLDDAQYSKGSYINRVRILENGEPKWLTIPVKVPLGTAIADVIPSDPYWPSKHLSRLRNAYRGAACFRQVWPDIETLIGGAPADNLAAGNRHIITGLCERLSIGCQFFNATNHPSKHGLKADDRLIELIGQTAGARSAVYLSGQGGRKYQDEEKFAAAGIGLSYTNFDPPTYAQAGADVFIPGLGIFDALFQIGWRGTRALVSCD